MLHDPWFYSTWLFAMTTLVFFVNALGWQRRHDDIYGELQERERNAMADYLVLKEPAKRDPMPGAN